MGNNVRLVLAAVCCFLAQLGSSQTIQKMTVRGDIRFRFATTEMICVMSNDEDKAKELVFDVTLPKDAFIANFSMEIEGKDYPGNVRKKQEARQEYLAARNSGHSGAIVEQSARHSNKFDVSVNIAAQSSVTFTLIYQELLRRRFGSYEYSVYIDGDSLDNVLDFSMEIYIQDRNEIKDVRTPAMRKEVISNVVEEGQNTLTQITNPSATTVVYVVYKPSREELKEMGGGWFVVQYDVDSDSAGDLLVVDGYFVHFFMPPDDLPPLPLDIVFVLDISGSMAGRKMEQLKVAMSTILDDLRETDRFNILLFDGSVQVWERTLQEASESNVSRAQEYVKTINYRGSTNLHLALMRGLELLQGSREAERVPMIFFLTDGEPTAGEQDPAKIIADVSSRNEGVVNIYSLAFGAGADYKMLRQVSAQNNGFARKIYEASDAAEQVLGLYKEISTIVIRGLTVTYHSTSNNDDGDDDDSSLITIDNSTITICDLSLVFGHSDFVVAGKLENAEALVAAPEKAGGLQVAVMGLGASEKINFILEENDLSQLTLEGDNPFWSVPRDLSKMAERAWAFLLLKQLLKEKEVAAENPDLVKELDERILELSLKYHFVTPLTSMVVTRPEDGLRKGKSVASFTADEDVPAAAGNGQMQFAHSLPLHRSQVAMMPPMRPPMRKAYISSSLQPSAFSPGSNYHSPTRGGLLGDLDFEDDAMDIGGAGMFPDYHQYGGAGMRPDYHQQGLTATQMALTRPLFRPTTTTTTTTTPPKRGRKKKKNKKNKAGKKKQRKGQAGGRRKMKNKKNKKCIRNKRVFLQSVLVHGQQMEDACYELKAARQSVRSYTLFAHQAANETVSVAMERRFLSSINLQHRNVSALVKVDSSGVLTMTLPQSNDNSFARFSADMHSVVFRLDDVLVTVNITKQTCKVSFLSVVIDIGDNDAPMGKYTGAVAKAFHKLKRSKRRKGKGKKKRVPKGCVGRVSADRAWILKGKYLARFAL